MKNIYITENQFHILAEKNDDKITFYEFFVNVKKYLKDLLTKPASADPDKTLLHNIDKKEFLNKMLDLGIVKKSEKIDEVFEEEKAKKVAKYYVQYRVPKRNFEDKVKELYKDIMNEQTVFANEQEIIDAIKANDHDNAYSSRGGLNEEGEGGGGATSCGSAMQGGGSNPDAGQYTVPFGNVQRRKFYSGALKRNKDSKNGSISVNR
jgi:hypothetical protein